MYLEISKNSLVSDESEFIKLFNDNKCILGCDFTDPLKTDKPIKVRNKEVLNRITKNRNIDYTIENAFIKINDQIISYTCKDNKDYTKISLYPSDKYKTTDIFVMSKFYDFFIVLDKDDDRIIFIDKLKVFA